MQFDLHPVNKTAAFWLSRAEAEDAALRDALLPLCRQLKNERYQVAVFASGTAELADHTAALLRQHRDRAARREVERERLAGQT
ncbi:MAG: hypothetical protein IJC43_07635 [Clostridia bacterium]|nr:hypothetical protein [Clostridia bacterium]